MSKDPSIYLTEKRAHVRIAALNTFPRFSRVSLPGYTVPSSFTVARLWLLDSIYHCLNDIKDNPALLESIPDVFWSKLVDSFFQFR